MKLRMHGFGGWHNSRDYRFIINEDEAIDFVMQYFYNKSSVMNHVTFSEDGKLNHPSAVSEDGHSHRNRSPCQTSCVRMLESPGLRSATGSDQLLGLQQLTNRWPVADSMPLGC